MSLGRVADIAMAIIGVTMAFVIVSHPATAEIIKAGGNAFTGALRASIGK